MPSWIVHLATAKEVIKKLNISNKNSFFIGNLIPDAERHVIKDLSVYVPYKVSHYSEIQNIDGKKEKLPNIEKFMENYKDYLYNSMVLGYLTHILTDFYWNKITYLRYTIRDNQGNCIGVKLNNGDEIKCDINERAYIKHKDFDIFKNYIIKTGNYIFPKYESKLLEDLKIIKEIPLNKEDINKIIRYLNEEHYDCYKEQDKYVLFTHSQIEMDYINSIQFVIEFLKNNILGGLK